MTRLPRGTRRALAGALIAAALVVPGPARAGDYNGFVRLPVYHPLVARELYRASPALNGTIGYVIDLGSTRPAGTPYTIRSLSGIGLLDFDVFYYPTLSSQQCPQSNEVPDGPDREKGVVQCAARYAVVMLLTGVNGTFRLNV